MTVPATKFTSPIPWKPRDLAVHRNNSQSTDSSTYSPLLTPRRREPTSIPASNMCVGACKLSATAFSAFDAPSTHLVVQVDLAPRRRRAAGLGHVAAELERTPRAERESSSSTTPSCTSDQPGRPPQSTPESCPHCRSNRPARLGTPRRRCAIVAANSSPAEIFLATNRLWPPVN